MKRLIGTILFAGAATLAQAQSIPGAPASAAKKELIQRLMNLQQPAFESLGRDLVERPARQMLGAAEQVLQTRVAPEKREAAAKQIQEHVRKYRDESAAVVRDRAGKIGQDSLGPILDEKYTEDELRQLLAALENPAYKKFQQGLPEMTNAFAQSFIKDLEPTVEPKLKTLEKGVATALGLPDAASSGGAKPSAPAAAKPPAKK